MNFNFNLDDAIDEDFFGSLEGKSSKLQQLFMDDVLSAEEQQQTLKYKRPKASDFKTKEVSEEASSNSGSSITLMAKVVNAFRQGKSQGKVGLALIHNPDETCAIIIYKTKANILTNLKLESSKLYKQLKYWQFYDDHNLYWSFSFDAPQDENEFVERLKSHNISYKEIQENTKTSEDVCKEGDVEQLEEDVDQLMTTSLNKDTSTSLIKRMAKMGTPLPLLFANKNKQIPTDYSDSSDTEVINTPLSLNPKPAIAPRGNKLSSNKSNQQLVASTVALQPSTVTSTAIYPINPLESQYMQMLLTEQRTQGSELRMNMNKLENKIEKVLDKLDLYDNRPESKQKPEKDDEILELEEKLLMLKKENRKLKQMLEGNLKENKLKDICRDQLLQDLREFNINPENGLQESVKQLIKQLRENINEKQLLEEKLNDSENDNKQLQKDLVSNEIKFKDIEQQLATLKNNEELLKTNLNEKENEMKQKQEEIFNLQKELQQQKTDKVNNISTDNLVKSIMNSLYVDIADKFNNSNFTQQEEILSLVATSIRRQTLDSLKQISFKEN